MLAPPGCWHRRGRWRSEASARSGATSGGGEPGARPWCLATSSPASRAQLRLAFVRSAGTPEAAVGRGTGGCRTPGRAFGGSVGVPIASDWVWEMGCLSWHLRLHAGAPRSLLLGAPRRLVRPRRARGGERTGTRASLHAGLRAGVPSSPGGARFAPLAKFPRGASEARAGPGQDAARLHGRTRLLP